MAEPHRELVRAIRSALAAVADPAKAAPMQAYMKSEMPFRGVQKPGRIHALRPVLAAYEAPDHETWLATIRGLWDNAEYREDRYAAIELARYRKYAPWAFDAQSMALYDHLIVTGAWWDYVDDVAIRLVGPVLRAHPDVSVGRDGGESTVRRDGGESTVRRDGGESTVERAGGEVTATIRRWAQNDDRWRRRAAVICQIGAREATDTELLGDSIVANAADTDFFLRKGIGWALRDYAKTDPDWVRAFVGRHRDRLSSLSVREATRSLPEV